MKVKKECIEKFLKAHRTNSGLTSKLKIDRTKDT